jgi:hypothetical protein
MSAQPEKKSRKERALWTAKMENYFVRLLQKAVDDGKGSDCNFKQAVLNEILRKFNTKLTLNFTYRQRLN